MKTIVVHVRDGYDVYIGRSRTKKFHFGNPFYIAGSMTRADSIDNFEVWIRGKGYHDLEPERRDWILKNLHKLEGERLGDFCAPKRCHGDILIKLLKERAKIIKMERRKKCQK